MSCAPDAPRVSIIIPTHQRRATLRRALMSLESQTSPSSVYEVVVAVDRSTDGTAEMLEGLSPSYALRVVVAPRRGRSAACNAALAHAQGEVMVFLDDDMLVSPGFVEAHRVHHPAGTRVCVLGPVPVALHAHSSSAARYVRDNFAAHHARLARPDHVFVPRDFYTGNASLRREVLDATGHFDEAFDVYGNEDVELFLRLAEAGVTLRFEPAAAAQQEYDKGLRGLAADTRAKGSTTVLLARTHPDVFDTLRLASPDDHSLPWLVARSLLLRITLRWRSMLALVTAMAAGLERVWPARSTLVYRALLDYAFWVGVEEALRLGDGDRLSAVAEELRRGPVDILTAHVAAMFEERLAFMVPARRLRLALVDRTVQRVLGRRSLRVMDAGCGDGLLTLAFAKRHPEWSLIGVDRREDLLRGACQRAEARGLKNVRFELGDLTMPLSDADFDVVIAVECLSEIPDDSAAVQRMVAALRPGGLFVTQVPERSWNAVLPGSASRWREEVRHGYDERGLRTLLEQAGLERVEVTPTYRSGVGLAQELRDRVKDAPLSVRAALLPLLAVAVRLERSGVTWGPSQALLAVARRSDLPTWASAR